jgi:membrane protease YdiL (CAAX protease family)
MKKLLIVVLTVLILNFILGYGILNYVPESDVTMQFLLKILHKYLLVIISVYVINKTALEYKVDKNSLFIIPLCLTVLIWAFFDTQGTIDDSGTTVLVFDHLLFLVSCIFVAVFEELFFRVYIFQKLLKIYKRLSLLKVVALASLVFALAHLVNVFKPGIEPFSVIVQVVMAFGLGFIFQAIYLKTRNIILPICIHALVNYFGSFRSQLMQIPPPEDFEYDLNRFLTSLGFMLVISSILITIGYLLIKQININYNNRNMI